MKKILIILEIIAIFVFILVNTAYSQSTSNHGAKFSFSGGIQVKMSGMSFENNSLGIVIVNSNSRLTVENDMHNNDGELKVESFAVLMIEQNFENMDMFNNYETSTTIVKKNILNEGIIYNASLIEIGE